MTEEFSTTFKSDFTIADRFGVAAVKDTFNRAFKEWKTDYRYLTDLVLVLNHKIWEHYGVGRKVLATIYDGLWRQVDDYARDNLKGDELHYFYRKID
jgi:hypothetical protein